MSLPINNFLQPVPEVPYETQALQYTIIPNTPIRAQKKVERANQVIETRQLNDDEIFFIVKQANKKKIDLSSIGLSVLGEVEIAVHEQDLFTIVTLFWWKNYDRDTCNAKIGVTKRTANEEHDPVRAKNIALWRAVLAPSIF